MVFKKDVLLWTWRIGQKNCKCGCYPKDTFQRENSRKLAWKSLYRRRCSTSCAVANQLCDKLFWNGMLRHWLDGVVFFFFAEPALDLMPCLQGWGMQDCNKGIKFKKGAINSCCILRRELQGGTLISIEKFRVVCMSRISPKRVLDFVEDFSRWY